MSGTTRLRRWNPYEGSSNVLQNTVRILQKEFLSSLYKLGMTIRYNQAFSTLTLKNKIKFKKKEIRKNSFPQ